MRNSLVMGVTVSALSLVGLSFGAVPASAQVTVGGQVTVQRHQDDERDRPDSDYDYGIDDDQGSDSSYGPYRPAGFGVQVSKKEAGELHAVLRVPGRDTEYCNAGRSGLAGRPTMRSRQAPTEARRLQLAPAPRWPSRPAARA